MTHRPPLIHIQSIPTFYPADGTRPPPPGLYPQEPEHFAHFARIISPNFPYLFLSNLFSIFAVAINKTAVSKLPPFFPWFPVTGRDF